MDRLLIEGIAWVKDTFEACQGSMPDPLSSCRSWRGVDGSGWLDIHKASDLARERGLRIYGSFGGVPGEDSARTYRAVLMLFAEEDEPPKAVVIAQDLDHTERARGFEQAATEKGRMWPFVVVGALAQPEIEAWLIAVWVPEDDSERQRLAALRSTLGFDPCAEPERLSSTNKESPKDAKEVLEKLTKTGRTATARWADAPIERLESSSEACRLAGFVRDVRKHLVPVVERG
ncbi:hypothetical protein [Sorangium cellulosum]|uniref:hypothetical protein n=1 Tax=Sorangium cellulosum TaxID=56 RepID=UPI0013317166|nr:hypothetical protein [Sorangium cellulosum]